ncbi:MAG: DUF1800 domain-containing protein [Planctomycetes bacterium]|nr:DUF1800 domain-containing protein [Planctomycetota bacterium]
MTRWAHILGQANNGQQIRAWWLYRMLYGPHPLREKLTLFWHNHFATSNAKVQNAAYMLGQNELLRRHALGSFRTLLQEISRDPAMMVWLDTSLSKKGMPNENYARELMELFSLGIGHYTETDIREAARAFTGWKLEGGKAVYRPADHDSGEKTVLGQKGPWKGQDIVRICLEQKSAAPFLTAKLFRFLVSETIPPEPALIEPLAEQFRQSDYDFGGLVRTVLRSNLFFSPRVYRTRIKSPVDFLVGIVRGLEGRPNTINLATALEQLGQNLFYPPSVKGWDGGTAWLNAQTLLFRQNLALALTSTEDARFGSRCDPVALLAHHGSFADTEQVDFFLRLFLQGDLPAESRERLLHYQQQARQQTVPVYWTAQDAADHRVRALCHLVLTLPEFQLH